MLTSYKQAYNERQAAYDKHAEKSRKKHGASRQGDASRLTLIAAVYSRQTLIKCAPATHG